MRRSLALIAVGAAVAVAAVVVIAGVSSSGEAGDAPRAAADALPSGHPSVAATGKATPVADDGAQVESAIALLEERRAEDPSDVGVLLDLGEAYFLGQRLQQARRAYTQVIEQDPENTAAKVGLALIWHAQGDSKRAEAALMAVLDAHPDDQDAHYSLAIVYFSSGRVDDAKAEWEAAAEIDPGSTTGRRSQSFVDLLEDQESSAPEADE